MLEHPLLAPSYTFYFIWYKLATSVERLILGNAIKKHINMILMNNLNETKFWEKFFVPFFFFFKQAAPQPPHLLPHHLFTVKGWWLACNNRRSDDALRQTADSGQTSVKSLRLMGCTRGFCIFRAYPCQYNYPGITWGLTQPTISRGFCRRGDWSLFFLN